MIACQERGRYYDRFFNVQSTTELVKGFRLYVCTMYVRAIAAATTPWLRHGGCVCVCVRARARARVRTCALACLLLCVFACDKARAAKDGDFFLLPVLFLFVVVSVIIVSLFLLRQCLAKIFLVIFCCTSVPVSVSACMAKLFLTLFLFCFCFYCAHFA